MGSAAAIEGQGKGAAGSAAAREEVASPSCVTGWVGDGGATGVVVAAVAMVVVAAAVAAVAAVSISACEVAVGGASLEEVSVSDSHV